MFKPGVSGNPNGRPKKGTALTDVLKDKVNAESLAEKLIEMCNNNDIQALKYVYDRIDGKPRESIDLDHSGGVDMNMTVQFVRSENDENT